MDSIIISLFLSKIKVHLNKHNRKLKEKGRELISATTKIKGEQRQSSSICKHAVIK